MNKKWISEIHLLMEVGPPNVLHFCFSVLDEFEHTFLIEQMAMLITEK